MVATASGTGYSGYTSREVLNLVASLCIFSLSLDPGRFKVLLILQLWQAEDYVFGVIYLIEICIKICGLKMDFFKDRTISVV